MEFVLLKDPLYFCFVLFYTWLFYEADSAKNERYRAAFFLVKKYIQKTSHNNFAQFRIYVTHEL